MDSGLEEYDISPRIKTQKKQVLGFVKTILVLLQPPEKKNQKMAKFLGFLVFVLVATMGFGMLMFLALFVGYWITLVLVEKVNPNMAYKMIGHKEEE